MNITICSSISPREIEVMHLIAAEYSTDEIADELFISFHTAKTHKRNLLNKLGARNSAGLVRRAFELGILKLNQ